MTTPKIKPAHERIGRTRITLNTGEGLTEQAHKKETDMNFILRNYQKTGIIQHVKKYQGQYDDVNVQDFQEAMFMVKDAETMFNDLPSSVRKKMNNDPAEFLAFVQNPDNRDELHKMGLLEGNDGRDSEGQFSGAPTAKPAGDPTAEPAGDPKPPGDNQ